MSENKTLEVNHNRFARMGSTKGTGHTCHWVTYFLSSNNHLFEMDGHQDKPTFIKKVEKPEDFSLEAVKVMQGYIDAYK